MKQSRYMAVGKSGLLMAEDLQETPDVYTDTKCYIGENIIHPCFIPSSILYSFYWPETGTYGIPESREISFSAADLISFQLAGYFEDQPSKPLYYIKRNDDQACLSLTLGGPAYTENHGSAYQQWLVSKLGTNKYCFVLPAVPGCFIIRPFRQKGKCFLSVMRSKDVKLISSVTLYMKEVN